MLTDLGVNRQTEHHRHAHCLWFSTGNTPGIPRSIRLAWVFGSEPNVVELPEKIFDRVVS